MRSREHAWSMTDRTRRGITLSWLVLFVLSIMLQYGNLTNPQSTLAVHNDGLFELDGNAAAEAGVGHEGDDWNLIDDGSADPNNDDTADASVFIVDAVPERSFTGGGSKDDLDTSAGGATAQVWAHTTQTVPDKDDIQHAFAALYGDVIYFGADRYDNDGDAQVGFWFFKNGISINANGTFTPVHTVGDLLVLSHFTNGGTTSTVELYEWVGSGGDTTSGTLDLIASGQNCTGAPATDIACAIANSTDQAAPWPYDAKQPDPDNIFGANAFFEGGLDLSDVFGATVPCFTGFLVETRASQSVDATLQDFTSGSFNTCASITIVKDAVPNDAQDFGFTTTGTGLSSFNLDDDADVTLSNTKVFSGLNPGAYTVTEGAVAGWDLTNLVCNDANGSVDLVTRTATLSLQASENVTCTYTNTKRGKIIIEKQTNPDGAAGSFGFSGEIVTSLSDGQSAEKGNLVPGTYTVTEANPTPPFDLVMITCDDAAGATDSTGDSGTRTATFRLDPGETVKCTFTNTQRGTITIIKDAVPNDPQDFHYNTTGGLSAFDLDDDANATLSNTQLYSNVVPGSYSVSEVAVAGWDLTDLSCNSSGAGTSTSINGATASLTLGPAGSIVCTYENTKRGHIIVDKVTLPGGDPTSFSFGTTGAGYSGFSLTDAAAPNNQEVLPGSYTVSETVPSGWDLTSATCDNGEAPNSIDVGPGETITCVFTNTKRGHIIVDKVTLPGADAQSFSFTTSGANYTGFSLTDAAAPNNQEVLPGTYSVSESVPAGWDLTSATCDEGETVADITVGPGETITCTFTNTKRGHIVVDKITLPGGDPQSFSFTTSGANYAGFSLTDVAAPNSQEVVPGSYTVAESVPAGWDLTSAVCDNGEAPNSVDVGPGETITCVFTNTKRGTIIVEKQTSPSTDDLFTFTGDAAGEIADNGTIVVDDLQPGTYTSTESDPTPDYDLTSIICDDAGSSGDLGSRTATFDLDPGEVITCVFTNVQRGTITIIKDAQPNDAQNFGYDVDGFDGPIFFELDDDANGTLSNMQTFENVPPGDYSITENTAVAGWDLTDLDCVVLGGSSAQIDGATANLTMAAGGSITCTYVNSKPSISIVKTAGSAADGTVLVQGPGPVTYTYVVTNTGPIALENIVVMDDNGTATTADDFAVTCPATTLAAGASMTCTATVTVNVNRTNVATATGESEQGTEVSDTDDAVVRVPGTSIDKSNNDADGIVGHGQNVTFTILVNVTSGPVTNAVVTDTLPLGQTYVAASQTSNPASTFAISPDGRTLTWTFASLATGSPAATITYHVTIDGNAAGAQTNVAQVCVAEPGVPCQTDSNTLTVPGLTILKDVSGFTGGTAVNGTPIAKIGDTLTYTLNYDISSPPTHNGVITDVVPAGLEYVVGSATSNAQFTFTSYNSATRTLTWNAPLVSVDGTLSFKVTVLATAPAQAQPIVNVAAIDSDETDRDDDDAIVLVQVVLAATATPVVTLPPTDTIDSGDQAPSNPGFGLMLALLVLAGFGLVMGYLTPTPGRTRREEVRRR